MDLLGALGVLVRVVETGSFSAVARERELSQAAVARQVSQEHFGVRLFHRTTRKLSLTDDGGMLVGLARPVLEGVDALEVALGRQSASPVGLVRVGVTVAASRFLAQRLPTLLADHPGLKVELVVGDRLGDMIGDRLDLAMRVGEITDTSLVARRCGTTVRVAAATPSYIKRHGDDPSSPAELADHICIVHDVGPDSDFWTFVAPVDDFLKCQTFAASPAEPGDLPYWVSLPQTALRLHPRRRAIRAALRPTAQGFLRSATSFASQLMEILYAECQLQASL
jgi:DNA-binding transcriptional LysR family regulator